MRGGYQQFESGFAREIGRLIDFQIEHGTAQPSHSFAFKRARIINTASDSKCTRGCDWSSKGRLRQQASKYRAGILQSLTEDYTPFSESCHLTFKSKI